MKKWLTGAAAAVMLSGLIPIKDTEAARLPFKDLPQDHAYWAEREINYLIGEGIISGYQDGTFRPEAKLTRQQAAGLMVQALDLKLEGRPDPNFKDIKKGAYYYEAIAAVADEGLIRGSNGNFRPNETITRAQMAAILRRAFQYELDEVPRFPDVERTYWAFADINAIAKNGITIGRSKPANGDNFLHFSPGEATTRVQYSVFLARALNGALRLYSKGAINTEPYENQYPNLGDYKISVDKDSIIIQNKKTGEKETIADKGILYEWYRGAPPVKNSQSTTIELDTTRVHLNEDWYLNVPVIIKGTSPKSTFRTVLGLYVLPEEMRKDRAPIGRMWEDPFDDFTYSKYNVHEILGKRFIGDIRNAGNGNVTVGIYKNGLPVSKMMDVVIKNERTPTGYKDPELRDFNSIRVDGVRYFYYNTSGLYSMYYDGTQKKQLLKGNIKSFKREGTTLYAELENGTKYKMYYTGTNLQKIN
ncbi:S-layer homology domain-containing protein [Bacillus infantis]|uniref:S-layer homology domain-containing protein n=1 Tax=Bacillus infantis TaxID=324767 RepID=UPI003CEDF222